MKFVCFFVATQLQQKNTRIIKKGGIHLDNLTNQTLKDRYVIGQFIGSGAMADVYKVWDKQRSVHLALKLLHEDLAEDAVFLKRFKREGLTLEKLQHPNIVRYYGLEQEDMHAFILMDFIDGMTLRSEIFRQRGTALSSKRIMEIMRPLCGASHYAHRQGYVHCDIKPSNIMTRVDGTVVLMDFGISYMTESATTTTLVGAGTPGYMSPEQIRGEKPQLSSDIYSLGVVLYEMMTGGERPFTGERAQFAGSAAEKIRWEQINLEPFSLPEKNAQVTPKLEAVVRKCLSLNPADRYADAMQLLSALQKALRGVQLGQDYQPVQVSQAPVNAETTVPPSNPAQPIPNPAPPKEPIPVPIKAPQKRAAPSKWLWAGALLVVAASLILLIPKVSLNTFILPAAPASVTPVVSSPTLAVSALAVVLPTEVPTLAASITPSPTPLRANSSSTPKVSSNLPKISVENVKSLKETSRLGRGSAEQAIWSPDGQTIAVASSTGIYFYDANSLAQVNFLNTASWIKQIQFGAQGQTIASLDTAGKISMWQVSNGRQIFTLNANKNAVFSISPDGKYLAYFHDASIDLLDASNGAKVKAQPMCCQNGEVYDLIFAPNSQYLATAGRMGLIYVWSIEYWGVYRAFEVPNVPISTISFSPDGTSIASGQKAGDSVVHNWDIYTKAEKPKFKGDYQADFVLYRSNDQIIYAYPTGGIQVWDLNKQQQVLKIENTSSIASLAVSPEAAHKYLLVVSKDMRVRIWDLDTGKVAKSIDHYAGPITSLAEDTTGRYLAASGLPGIIQLWDRDSGQESIIDTGQNAAIRVLKFSPDGKTLVSGGDDQIVHLWDLQSRQPKVISNFKTGAIHSLAFDKDGRLIAAGDSQGMIVIWDALSGNQVTTFHESGSNSPVRALAFNDDGRYIAATSEDGVIRVWDLKASQMLNVIRFNEAPGETPPLLFGGDVLASASNNNVLLWNISGWKKGNSFRAGSIGDFSPDLRLFAYARAGSGSNITFLDLSNGNELTSFFVSPASITHVLYGYDGKSVYIGGEDGAVRIWNLKP
jgi:WD40 repeat protein/tRNA A-37 threonylcarbamoyl transferase component Bud32